MLTNDEITRIGTISRKAAGLWTDVQIIADTVHATEGAERCRAWHHLLLAAANFKAPAKVYVSALPAECDPDIHQRDRDQLLQVPAYGGNLEVRAEDPTTWMALEASIIGLGIPRTTTVLSALWPHRHVIMDWRSLSAALALAGSRLGWEKSRVDPLSTAPAEKTWENYHWYRTAVVECAGSHRPPVDVERALYRLAQRAPGITWEAYAALLEQRIAP
jgi:hypothetical protein